MLWVGDVLRFWFEDLKPDDWFSGSAAIDRRIGARFSGLRETLKQSPPSMSALDAAGHVATIIVFDQFSRNLFRGRAEAFATDRLALDYATNAITLGLDATMQPPHQHFLYLPFMHAEDPALQDRSADLFAKLGPDLLKYAIEHRRVIERFGRFPGRNEALGRTTTQAEHEYLGSLKNMDSQAR